MQIKLLLAICGFLSFTTYFAQAQIRVDINLERSEYLLFEAIEIQVKITNYLSKPLDMARMAGANSWLDFSVTTMSGEPVPPSDYSRKIPNMALLSNQEKTVEINLLPWFFIQNPGEYRVKAQVTLGEEHFDSPQIYFSIVRGVTVWQSSYSIPLNSKGTSIKVSPRSYFLIVHQEEQEPTLYARIVDDEKNYIYCTTPLGSVVSYGDPQARIDRRGDLHILHQSGARTFTYTHISDVGKRLNYRFFTNLQSAPGLEVNAKDETEVIGGEEFFLDQNKNMTLIPTAPLGKALPKTK